MSLHIIRNNFCDYDLLHFSFISFLHSHIRETSLGILMVQINIRYSCLSSPSKIILNSEKKTFEVYLSHNKYFKAFFSSISCKTFSDLTFLVRIVHSVKVV